MAIMPPSSWPEYDPSVKVCHLPDCDSRVQVRRGLCAKHYTRLRKYGSTDLPPKPTFDQLQNAGGPDECWVWSGPRHSAGYGKFRNRYAHRVAYERAHGAAPAGMDIDHKCRNRACVNPAHLQAVTHAENGQNLHVGIANTSGHRGVSWHAPSKAWRAYASANGVRHWAGYFGSKEAAATAARDLRNRLMTNNLRDRGAA